MPSPFRFFEKKLGKKLYAEGGIYCDLSQCRSDERVGSGCH